MLFTTGKSGSNFKTICFGNDEKIVKNCGRMLQEYHVRDI